MLFCFRAARGARGMLAHGIHYAVTADSLTPRTRARRGRRRVLPSCIGRQSHTGTDLGIFSFLKKKDGHAGRAPPARRPGCAAASRRAWARQRSRARAPARDRARHRRQDRRHRVGHGVRHLQRAGAGLGQPARAPGPHQRPDRRRRARRRTPCPCSNWPPPNCWPTTPLPDAAAQPQTAPVIEEIAIMYANDQPQVAEQMLVDSLADVGQHRPHRVVDAVRPVPGQRPQDAFDNIAIDYASRFETSPPAWNPLPPAGADKAARRRHPDRVVRPAARRHASRRSCSACSNWPPPARPPGSNSAACRRSRRTAARAC